MEQLFLANAPPPAAEARASSRLSTGRQKEAPTALLDTKLANNIEIALKHIHLNTTQIAAALTSGDAGALTLDELSTILAVLPNADQLAVVQVPLIHGTPHRGAQPIVAHLIVARPR